MQTTNRRRFLTLASAALATPALSRRAFADVWPKDKIIRAVVPFSAGSTVDIIGRVVLDPLSRQLGQTMIVDNRGSAGGTIGSARRRQVGSGRLHAVNQRRRPFRRTGRISAHRLRSIQGFCRRRRVRRGAERVDGRTIERHQDRQGTSRARQGRPHDLFVPPASAVPPIGRQNASFSPPASRRRIFRSAADRRR